VGTRGSGCRRRVRTSTRDIVAHVREPKQAFAQRRVPETVIHLGEQQRRYVVAEGEHQRQ
jgi:hypothetical protein